jgi:hypothetical protein
MVRLFDSETGRVIGEIADAQLQFLVDQLEEESSDDRDYYVNADTIDLLEQDGADPALVKLLRDALGTREGMDVRWERDPAS